MKPAAFDYVRATSVDDALRHLRADPGAAKLIAGGQSLGPMLNLRLARPSRLVDIGGLGEICQVDVAADVTFVGAGVTHAAFEDRRVPDGSAGFMPHVARTIAYRAVRNRGTIGGSIAHADPAADWMLALTALDAQVIVAGAGGTRSHPLGAFAITAFTTLLADDEMVVGFAFPTLSAGTRFGHCKIARKFGKFADAAAAVVVDPQRELCRIAIGWPDGAPRQLAPLAASFARSGRAAPGEIAQAIEDALPGLDPYDGRILRGALAHALAQASRT